jgi:hypothetical protein
MASPKLEPVVLTDEERQGPGRVVVGLYMSPPENALVLCVDEKSASSSWNLAERWFAELTGRKLRRSAHRSVTELEAGIRKWVNEWNKDPRPFAWTKSADEILEAIAEYCQRAPRPGTLAP